MRSTDPLIRTTFTRRRAAPMRQAALAVFASVLCGALAAAPAAWQVWRSKSTGLSVCAQVSPGEGWERAGGPYRDPHCSNPGFPGGG